MEPLHLGDRSALERLQRDIVAPARALGCRSVWLAGISLGGFIALDYAATHPGQWDGLCLLAPYLGNRMLIAEIAAARGLAAWQPGPLAESDEERRIWRFIQTQRAEAQRAQSPPIYLGYGRADRFAPAHGLMAQALPPDAVDVVPGGHDWHTWSTLWEQFLGFEFQMSQRETKQARWVPSPLLFASAALHLGAGAATLIRPRVWPWALGAVVLNHVVLTAAGLWPKSRLLGPNLTRLPARSALRGEVAITIDDGPDPEVTPRGPVATWHVRRARELLLRGRTRRALSGARAGNRPPRAYD